MLPLTKRTHDMKIKKTFIYGISILCLACFATAQDAPKGPPPEGGQPGRPPGGGGGPQGGGDPAARLAEFIKRADTDADGKISKDEFANLGKKDATSITLADTGDVAKIFSQTTFNGDGIIVAESAADDATKALIADLISTHGSVADRAGKPGLDQARVEAFFADAVAFEAWLAKSETDAATVLPLGESSAAASTGNVATTPKASLAASMASTGWLK